MRRVLLFFWLLVFGLLAAATLLVGLAASAVTTPTLSALLAPALVSVLATRLRFLRRDPPRARWVIELFDRPALTLLMGAVLGLPVFLVLAAPALLGRFAFGPGALSAVAVLSLGVGVTLALWGAYVEPRCVRVRRHELPVDGLSAELDGYRVVHLSDLHLGSFTSERRALRWIEITNRLRADAVAVTGDLVSVGVAYYPLVARVLGKLRARDGVFVCFGNHDTADKASFGRLLGTAGLIVLRDDVRRVTRPTSESPLLFAGMDVPARPDFAELLAREPAELPAVVLAHYPTHGERLARRPRSVVLTGHTHGGQLGVPGVAARWNLAALTGQASAGLVRRGESWLHVSAGLGTSGPPIRLGIPPDVTLLTLRAASGAGRLEA